MSFNLITCESDSLLMGAAYFVLNTLILFPGSGLLGMLHKYSTYINS